MKARFNSAAALLRLLLLMYGVLSTAKGAAAVIDKSSPSPFQRLFGVHLQQKSAPPEYVREKNPPALSNSSGYTRFARLANETWFNEEVTCVRKSGDGKLIAVGGYLRKTSLWGRMPKRVYGSRIHVLEAAAHKEILSLETAPVAERTREEKGGSKILDCLFVSNSRYLAAVTNSKLFLWDTQRGELLSEFYFDRAVDTAVLEHGTYAGENYLAVVSGKNRTVFQIVGL